MSETTANKTVLLVEAAIVALTKLAQQLREVDDQMDDEPAGDERGRTTPVCQVHQVPMRWMRTKRGSFWSCHEKDTDGHWCRYRPQ